MSVTIYVEGGGKGNKAVQARCREGFAAYCKKLVAPGRCPKIVACGGRADALRRFQIAIRSIKTGDCSALLVDSEGPLQPGQDSASFLRAGQYGNLPHLQDQHVFLLVQAMEAWLLADREAVAEYYGPKFHANALRGDRGHVETIPKDDLEASLTQATRDTQKGCYHKTRHAFDLLARVDPTKVEAASPRAREFHEFLRGL